MTSNAIQIAAVHPRLAGRLASNSAQCCYLIGLQPMAMLVMALSEVVKILTPPEEMKLVAEFAAPQAGEGLLRIVERRIHPLAQFVSQQFI